jgi:hypothetical protein
MHLESFFNKFYFPEMGLLKTPTASSAHNSNMESMTNNKIKNLSFVFLSVCKINIISSAVNDNKIAAKAKSSKDHCTSFVNCMAIKGASRSNKNEIIIANFFLVVICIIKQYYLNLK